MVRGWLQVSNPIATQKFFNSALVNAVPLSDTNSSGGPCIANIAWSFLIVWADFHLHSLEMCIHNNQKHLAKKWSSIVIVDTKPWPFPRVHWHSSWCFLIHLALRTPMNRGFYLTIDTWPPNYTPGNNLHATQSGMSSMQLVQHCRMASRIINRLTHSKQQSCIDNSSPFWVKGWNSSPSKLCYLVLTSSRICESTESRTVDFFSCAEKMGEVYNVSMRRTVSPGRGTKAGASSRGNRLGN